MTTFVLVPGFWLGAWAWDEVAERLRADGHACVAVTPVGVGERAARTSVTIADRVDDVVACVSGRSEPVVLVGHSGGGPVCVAAAEWARDRVAALVFVDTGPLPEGMSHLDFVGPERARTVRSAIAEHGGWYPMPSREALGAAADGMDDATFDRVRSRSTPEPEGTVCTSARRAAEPDRSLPKTVVACTFTAGDVRAAAAAGAPGLTEMVGPEWTVVELPTGHWPMFSEPDGLARVLSAVDAPAAVG